LIQVVVPSFLLDGGDSIDKTVGGDGVRGEVGLEGGGEGWRREEGGRGGRRRRRRRTRKEEQGEGGGGRREMDECINESCEWSEEEG